MNKARCQEMQSLGQYLFYFQPDRIGRQVRSADWGQLTDNGVKEFECYSAVSETKIELLEEQYEKISLAILLNMDQNTKTGNRDPCQNGKGKESNIRGSPTMYQAFG